MQYKYPPMAVRKCKCREFVIDGDFGWPPLQGMLSRIQCGQVQYKEQSSKKLNSEEWVPGKW